MSQQLQRSRTDSMVAGVAGGLARYLRIDATMVRLVFVLLAFADGIGLLIYGLLWIVMPLPEEDEALSPDGRPSERNTAIVVGAGLVIMGGLFLLERLNISWLWWLDFDILWPILLVAGGILILVRTLKGDAS